ncbi:MAG: FadR/GntR family transcriptional regulator [Candidatus Bipolaricaulota bacterium]
MTPFDKAREPKKRSSFVAEQIIEAIRNEEYQSGDRLPSERAIAEQMDVSRNSVREAFSALQIVNIVETKAGSGTYVKTPGAEVDLNKAVTLARESEDLLEVWEARKEVELSLLRLALRRSSKAETGRLDANLAEMREAIEQRSYQGYLQANERFHVTIADLARNSYLSEALQALLGVTREHLLKSMIDNYEQYMENSLSAHEAIKQVIEDEQTEKVSEVIDLHFDQLGGHLKENLFRE